MYGMNTAAIPNPIRAARKAANLTQKQLAEQLGVTQAAVSTWELGVARPSHKVLGRLADALGCEVNDLVGEQQAA